MARTKAAVRRLPVKIRHFPGWLVNKDYCRSKTIYPFKIKETLLQLDCKHPQEWTNNKSNKCQVKIQVF